MPAILLLMPALSPWLVVLALLAGGAAEQEHSTPHPVVNSTWQDLLQAALDGTEEDKTLVEQIASESPEELVGKLAQVLLEEWDLAPSAEELQQPRRIAAPKPDYSDLAERQIRLKSAVVAASGEVTPAGAVENIEVRISSGVEEIDDRCVDAFSRWRYRPARGDCGYLRSMVAVTCHVHPR